MRTIFPILVLACLLTACEVDINFPIPVLTQAPLAPSRTPHLITSTAPVPVTATPAGLPVAGLTMTPTATLTPTPTPQPTVALPVFTLAILGCDTSLDLTHQMGEVTNAYIGLSNTGQADATNVCALLSGSDEARPHPDKTACVPALPAHTRVTFKLTIDTGFGVDSRIRVEVSSAEQAAASLDGGSCKAIGAAPAGLAPFGIVAPIP